MLPASPRCKISTALVILILTSISSSLILNLIAGSLIFHSKGCRCRSHDYHESPKSDFFVYYPRLRFISLVLLFYAWHLCLAVITHRVLPFFFSLPFHLGTLFPFATLYAVPDVNLFFSILISNLQFFIHFFFFLLSIPSICVYLSLMNLSSPINENNNSRIISNPSKLHDVFHRSHLSLATCDRRQTIGLGVFLPVACSHVSGRYRYPRCIFCLISVQSIPATGLACYVVYLNLAGFHISALCHSALPASQGHHISRLHWSYVDLNIGVRGCGYGY